MAAGDRLNPSLGVLGLAMGPKSASHLSTHDWMAQEMSHYHWCQFETSAFHVEPSMGPTVSDLNLNDWQNLL